MRGESNPIEGFLRPLVNQIREPRIRRLVRTSKVESEQVAETEVPPKGIPHRWGIKELNFDNRLLSVRKMMKKCEQVIANGCD